MNTISFNSANFVARQVNYHMTGGWGQGDKAANDWFRPLDSFSQRFDAMLAEIADLGFSALDLWTGHLNYTWATPDHIEIARGRLAAHKLRVASYAGGFGGNVDEFRSACRLCAALNIPVMGGGTNLLRADRSALTAGLREFGLIFGFENHPEKSVAEILAKIGEGDSDVIGVAADTGWMGTQGLDAPAALRQLGPRLKYVHLKDVKARRPAPTGFQLIDMGHETCRYGDGIVKIQQCVNAPTEIGYRGPLSIEHEPEDFDPRPDVAASKAMLEGWLSGAAKKPATAKA